MLCLSTSAGKPKPSTGYDGRALPDMIATGAFTAGQFLRLLPLPGRQTLDVGCCEGRLTRDLMALGHRVVAIDSSPSMVEAAREFDRRPRVRGNTVMSRHPKPFTFPDVAVN